MDGDEVQLITSKTEAIGVYTFDGQTADVKITLDQAFTVKGIEDEVLEA